MAHTHCIGEMIVNISFNSKELERREQPNLRDWLVQELLPALDTLFEQYVSGTHILKFDSLRFDFGKLSVDEYQEVITRELSQKMLELIQKSSLVDSHALMEHSRDALSKNFATTQIDQFIFFLQTGQIPWHRLSSLDQDTEGQNKKNIHVHMLKKIIGDPHLKIAIRKLPQKADVAQRLVNQFYPQLLLKLLSTLTSTHTASVVLLMAELNHALATGTISQAQWKIAAKICTENCLNEKPATWQWLDEVVGFLINANLKLLKGLIKNLSGKAEANSLTKELQQRVAIILEPRRSLTFSSENVNDGNPLDPFYIVEQAFWSGNYASLDLQLDELASGSNEQLCNVIRKHLNQHHIRQRVALTFHLDLLEKICVILLSNVFHIKASVEELKTGYIHERYKSRISEKLGNIKKTAIPKNLERSESLDSLEDLGVMNDFAAAIKKREFFEIILNKLFHSSFEHSEIEKFFDAAVEELESRSSSTGLFSSGPALSNLPAPSTPEARVNSILSYRAQSFAAEELIDHIPTLSLDQKISQHDIQAILEDSTWRHEDEIYLEPVFEPSLESSPELIYEQGDKINSELTPKVDEELIRDVSDLDMAYFSRLLQHMNNDININGNLDPDVDQHIENISVQHHSSPPQKIPQLHTTQPSKITDYIEAADQINAGDQVKILPQIAAQSQAVNSFISQTKSDQSIVYLNSTFENTKVHGNSVGNADTNSLSNMQKYPGQNSWANFNASSNADKNSDAHVDVGDHIYTNIYKKIDTHETPDANAGMYENVNDLIEKLCNQKISLTETKLKASLLKQLVHAYVSRYANISEKLKIALLKKISLLGSKANDTKEFYQSVLLSLLERGSHDLLTGDLQQSIDILRSNEASDFIIENALLSSENCSRDSALKKLFNVTDVMRIDASGFTVYEQTQPSPPVQDQAHSTVQNESSHIFNAQHSVDVLNESNVVSDVKKFSPNEKNELTTKWEIHPSLLRDDLLPIVAKPYSGLEHTDLRTPSARNETISAKNQIIAMDLGKDIRPHTEIVEEYGIEDLNSLIKKLRSHELSLSEVILNESAFAELVRVYVRDYADLAENAQDGLRKEIFIASHHPSINSEHRKVEFYKNVMSFLLAQRGQEFSLATVQRFLETIAAEHHSAFAADKNKPQQPDYAQEDYLGSKLSGQVDATETPYSSSTSQVMDASAISSDDANLSDGGPKLQSSQSSYASPFLDANHAITFVDIEGIIKKLQTKEITLPNTDLTESVVEQVINIYVTSYSNFSPSQKSVVFEEVKLLSSKAVDKKKCYETILKMLLEHGDQKVRSTGIQHFSAKPLQVYDPARSHLENELSLRDDEKFIDAVSNPLELSTEPTLDLMAFDSNSIDSIFMALKNGEIELDVVAPKLADVKYLVKMFVEAGANIVPEFRQSFLNSIERKGISSNTPYEFYKNILFKILYEKDIDLGLSDIDEKPVSLSDSTALQYQAPAQAKNIPNDNEAERRRGQTYDVIAKSLGVAGKETIVENNNGVVLKNTIEIHPQLNNERFYGDTAKTTEANQQASQKNSQLIEIQRIVQVLTTATPGDLQTLFAFLKSEPYLTKSVALKLGDLQHLVRKFIETSATVSSEFRETLLTSIEQYGSKSAHQYYFYSRVLNDLLHEQAIDFDIEDAPQEVQAPAVTISEVEQSVSPNNQPEYVGEIDELHFLLNRAALNSDEITRLHQLIKLSISTGTVNSAKHWLNRNISTAALQRLIEQIPPLALHKLLQQNYAQDYSIIEGWTKIVMDALALLVSDIHSRKLQLAKWKLIFTEILFNPASAAILSARQKYISHAIQQFSLVAGVDENTLQDLVEQRLALLEQNSSQGSSQQQTHFALENSDSAAGARELINDALQTGIHIENAGLVIAAPYLPRLFSMFQFTNDGEFVNVEAQDRAAHFAQYLVTGKSHHPEFGMLLNKLLCGMNLAAPLTGGIELSEHESSTMDSMLTSMIQHWSILGSTSIAGLRETFLQRQGWLSQNDEGWLLEVHPGPFDMLLDQIPWGFAIIKHSWMEQPLTVKWR